MSQLGKCTRRPKPKFEVGNEVWMKLKIVGVDKRYNPPVYRVLSTSMKTRYHIEESELVREKK